MRLIDEKGGVRELAPALAQARVALQAYETLHGIVPNTFKPAPAESLEDGTPIGSLKEAYEDLCGKLAGCVAQREFLKAAIKTYAPKIWEEIKKVFEETNA
jgi:hypothetical protein